MKMNEILKVKKTGKSKFGFYLLIEGEEGDKFRSTSEAVSKYLEKQVPCEIEVTESGERGSIVRVKVSKSFTPNNREKNEFEEPVETVKMSDFKQANEYKENYWDWKKEAELSKQEEIVNEFCVREAIQLIKLNNESSEEKLKPTMNVIYLHAKMIKSILLNLKLGEEDEKKE